jgi:Fis family transcriptional regulator, factor for inversion stimulation protein
MFESTVKSDSTPVHEPVTTANGQPLRESCKKAMRNYFAQLSGEDVTDLYELFLSEVEAPLLEEVMSYVRSNQTRAANMLGINRGTLRKKLKKYGMS